MKIQAYMPVFNEADILPHTLRHLHKQGCSVHVIDGWSTDGSDDIAREQAEGFEYFPVSGPDPIQNCTAILKRIEDLAAESDADWILYTDADEWRRAPRQMRMHWGVVDFVKNPTIIDAVGLVDGDGYNAVDFRVFQFYPTAFPPFGWEPHINPEDFFHYYDETDCISRIPNRKLWKNVGRVQLAGGGHEVQFPGMHVYPQKFVMKHYPFRTPAQAKAKIETRLARRRMEEHAAGWGVHYDQYPKDFAYCWDHAKLKLWNDTRSALPRRCAASIRRIRTMNKQEFEVFTKQVNERLGNLQMTWEGPEPHDFRDMKSRGVRFVHSELFSRLPDFAWLDAEGTEWAPGGKVEHKIAVGDDEAAAEIMELVRSAGYDPTYKPAEGTDQYGTVRFDAVVNSAT